MIKRLRFLLIGSPDRVITTLSLIVGIAGLVVSVLAYKNPSPPPWYVILRDEIVVLTFLLILMALSVKYFKKDGMTEGFRELITQQWASNHHLTHGFRNHYFWDLRNRLATKPNMDSTQIDSMKKDYFENVCQTLLTDTRNIFLDYYRARGFRIGDDLTVTVKLIITAEDAQQILTAIKGNKAEILSKEMNYIVTGYRDPDTWGKKPHRNEVMRIIYHIDEENTTFDEIINNGRDFFLSNNLQKDYENEQYRNQNINWRNSYNAVLAVPIRYRRQGDHRATVDYGILSVDSRNTHNHVLFDEKNTYHLLATSADMLALMFGHLDMLQLAFQLAPGDPDHDNR